MMMLSILFIQSIYSSYMLKYKCVDMAQVPTSVIIVEHFSIHFRWELLNID